MDMPQPGPGHKRLERLAGNWIGEEIMHPSDWAPQGSTATGRNLNRMALGGFALITDYTQERDGVITFTGHGVMTFDTEAALYRLYWFDSMGSPPEVFEGRFAGEVLTIGHGGPRMHARLTYDLSDPERWVSKMEMSPNGEVWQTMFDGAYRRG